MITLKERFGMDGYVISAVHLIKGIGILAGLEVLEVPGITGYFDTNYDGKAQYAMRGLKEKDFVYVHVEAPDEAGHMGNPQLKIEAIEAFDEKIVGPILEGMKDFRRYKVLVLPDHPTPLSVRTHTADPVPYVIYSNEDGATSFHGETFDEVSAGRSGILIEKGFELVERFLNPCGSC
jgi:2,3-bisphosphoglycerate-independent phosphoglycerate mutase